MRARFNPSAIWQHLHSTYWFLPALMTAGAVALALVMTAIDRGEAMPSPLVGWVYGGGADGARALLSAVAGSMITVISLTFSVTIVALTVTSQHFGPRLLNSFMRDTVAQVVLGAFIGTFAYCLLVLRTVQAEANGRELFVPHLAVTVGLVLTFLSLAALITFIHHISVAMQVSTITAGISRDLTKAIERLYPESIGEDADGGFTDVWESGTSEGADVHAVRSGYVQQIVSDDLLELARKYGVTIRLRARPGDFVVSGTPLAWVSEPPADLQTFSKSLNGLFAIGRDRTSQQDAGFAVQQLVEVALHALSPGMNEPFTAITCIDRLGEGLALLATRSMPSTVRRDTEGVARVIAPPHTFEELLHGAFTPIAIFAGPNPAIYERLIGTLAVIRRRLSRKADARAVEAQAAIVWEAAQRGVQHSEHRVALKRVYEDLQEPTRS